jgi:ATP-dependent DNA helicase RecG
MRIDPTVLQALEVIYAGVPAESQESETLDFKQESKRSQGDTEKLLVEATLCFANSSGGNVVLGVRNKPGGPEALVGSTIDANVMKQKIFEQTNPHLAVDVESFEFRGSRLLVIRAPESPEIHADTQGRAPRRINRDCMNMSPAEQVRHREDRRGIDWSAAASDRAPTDVSRRALDVARDLLARHPSPERQALARRQDPELLVELGALRQDDRLSRAGEVLFCSTADGSDRLVYLYRETPGGEPTELRRFGDPLIVAYARVMELVEARRRLIPVTLPKGQQLPIEDFPNLAVREALTNGVVHRDHQLPGPVTVSHSPQLFEISSPGPLVAGVTPDNILTHDSKPRNAVLAKAARLLTLAEEVGAGVDRIYREMIYAGNDLPRIESNLERVRVTLAGGAANTRIPYFVSQLPSEERTDVDTLLIIYTLCHRRRSRRPMSLHFSRSAQSQHRSRSNAWPRSPSTSSSRVAARRAGASPSTDFASMPYRRLVQPSVTTAGLSTRPTGASSPTSASTRRSRTRRSATTSMSTWDEPETSSRTWSSARSSSRRLRPRAVRA